MDMKHIKTYGAFLNEANGDNHSYPEMIMELLNGLIGVGFKKYQLKVNVYQGKYMIELPDTGLALNDLKQVVNLMPEGSVLGYYKNLGSSLMIRTNVSV
jgi:hypothetical protein